MRNGTALLLALSVRIAVADGPVDGGSMAVFIKGGDRLTAGTLAAMEEEADRSVASAGLRLLWKQYGSQENRSYADIVVVKLAGYCSPGLDHPSQTIRHNGEQLGMTHVANGEVLPFIEIECDAVRALLRTEYRNDATLSAETLGHALGRVLAHELYHVLLHTTRHERSGLAAPHFTSEDLESPGRTFGPKVERKLQQINDYGLTFGGASSSK